LINFSKKKLDADMAHPLSENVLKASASSENMASYDKE